MNEWVNKSRVRSIFLNHFYESMERCGQMKLCFDILRVSTFVSLRHLKYSFCFSRRMLKEMITVHALTYCVGPLFVAKTAVTCQSVDLTRALRACCGIWHRGVSSSSFKTCQLQGGPPRVGRACSAYPTDANLIETWGI